MIYGQIVDGVCVNVIVAEPAWIESQSGEWIQSTDTNVAWIGAKVTEGVFELTPREEREE
jgi:hypothetical protein